MKIQKKEEERLYYSTLMEEKCSYCSQDPQLWFSAGLFIGKRII